MGSTGLPDPFPVPAGPAPPGTPKDPNAPIPTEQAPTE